MIFFDIKKISLKAYVIIQIMLKIEKMIEKYPMHNIGYKTLLSEVEKIKKNEYPYSTETGSMIIMKEIIFKIKSLIEEDDLDETITYCNKIIRKELNSIFKNRVTITETSQVREKVLEICSFLSDDIRSCNIAMK